MMASYTVVEYFGPQENSRCGYCVSSNTSQSHGMWAHYMTVNDYQDLIDRGWRRSGLYCYKPNNKTTCCPSYTIKCDAQSFRLSKSHKKILKKINAFLLNGIRTPSTDNELHCDSEQPMNTADTECGADNESRLSSLHQPTAELKAGDFIENINTESTMASSSRSETAPITVENESTNSIESHDKSKVVGPDPTKPLKLKAKFLRAQRKLEKQQKNAASSSTSAPEVPSPAKKPCRNMEQTLQSLLNAAPTNGRHNLQVSLVPSVEAATDEALLLYKAYQIGVHKDPPQKISRKSFENFLVRSPLQITLVRTMSDTYNETEHETFNLYKKYQTIIHHDPPENIDEFIDFLCQSPIQHETPVNGPDCGYGSFHQQYRLDGRLIAVGVIDILPKCISSVYFFYDPEFSFLTLGTYGILREIQFVKELSATVNSLTEYYMGFYIHSCPKMRYKGKLQPSYLLCPEVYTWHELNDNVRDRLNASKYSRINADPEARDVNQFIPANDLNDVRLLVNLKFARTYGQQKSKNAAESSKLRQTVVEYGQLVGKVLAKRQFLIHSPNQ